MNGIATPFRQLLERKLWPLAVLLIAALAAVPMLLAKESAQVAAVAPVPAAGAAAATSAAAITTPIVSLGAPADREARRKVLGTRKNPFEPAVKAKKAATTTSTTTTTADGTAKTGGTAPKPSSGAPTVTVPPVDTDPKTTYDVYGVSVTFGRVGAKDDITTGLIRRLTAFPKMTDPKIVFIGLRKDHETALFVVAANTKVVTNGDCTPDPANCQILSLRKGDNAYVDVLDASGQTQAQYELDLVNVLHEQTTDADGAREWRRGIAEGGRAALRPNVSRVNGWTFDSRTGTLVAPK